MENHSGKGYSEIPGLKILSAAQKVVTPLAVTLLILYGKTEKPFLLIPALVLGALAVALWLTRRLYEGDLYKKAMRLADDGKHLEALGLLIRAEEAWALNEAHSTPKTIANDFRHLTEIVTAIQSQVHTLGGNLDIERMTKAIGVYVAVYSNKKNLVFGTHRLKASAEAEIMSVNAVFPALRGQLRATCQELYKAFGGWCTQPSESAGA